MRPASSGPARVGGAHRVWRLAGVACGLGAATFPAQMLDPYPTLNETGFSATGEEDLPPVGWTPELIASLDWLRLAELARAIAQNAGCELGGSRVFEDGSVVFAMFEEPRSASPRRALVKLTGWNDWSATPQMVEQFADEVRTARNARGVLIAPGGFTPAASHAAAEHHIEPVDAARLCATLKSLPEERSDFFHVLTTTGEHSTPTCPVCLKKMTLDSEEDAETQGVHSEFVFQASAIVAEPVSCRRLEVLPNVEVQFLHTVRAQEILVSGHVTGDFVCEGRLTLGPCATLSGTVAARSVDVHEGGELIGKARIIEGDLQPVVLVRRRTFWRCHNPLGKANCPRVQFDLHD
ncbi:MAG: polymer-forming cytoskeletal protein [Verrucomicrobiaceae bacterium]|nr:polymer-forming cytoskeletal protein [Verrucomicrobiaceae bacterium]